MEAVERLVVADVQWIEVEEGWKRLTERGVWEEAEWGWRWQL